MDMADIYCYAGDSSYNIFHSSAEETIRILFDFKFPSKALQRRIRWSHGCADKASDI
jgi:hypothetical protein